MITKKQKVVLEAKLTLAHNDYEKGLNARAFFKTHSHALGEDLVQDTFLKTWKYLIKGGKIDIMKAFLYHVLNNLIIDEYRKHKTISLDVLIEKGLEPKIDDSARLFNTLDGKAALLLINHLPKKYRKVMKMRYLKDMSIEEISLIIKQPKNTITVQMHRGLKKLKILYKNKN